MIVNGKELVQKAREGHYAIGAFNSNDYVTVEIILQAAEALKTPVMLQTADYTNPNAEGRRLSDFDAKNFMRFVVARAEASPVPVVIHLDHCNSFEGCVRAIQYGATSVMIDGSMLPFEENVALTNKVIELARSCNVCVEAEIGHVGNSGEAVMGYTSVEAAKAFYEATGVDMLAVAIGTIHGVYTSPPVLQYALIAELRAALPIPLVMHGSSGMKPQQYRDAISSGIAKVNFATYLQLTAGEAMRDAALATTEGNARMSNLIRIAQTRGVEYIRQHINYFGTRVLYSN